MRGEGMQRRWFYRDFQKASHWGLWQGLCIRLQVIRSRALFRSLRVSWPDLLGRISRYPGQSSHKGTVEATCNRVGVQCAKGVVKNSVLSLNLG